MAFTDLEIADHMKVLEDSFWSRRRPPLHLRAEIREGQRFLDQVIELFLVRPAYNRPGQQIEESLARVQFVRTTDVWRLFWKRADGKWHRYQPHPEAKSLATALGIIHKDANGCFLG